MDFKVRPEATTNAKPLSTPLFPTDLSSRFNISLDYI